MIDLLFWIAIVSSLIIVYVLSGVALTLWLRIYAIRKTDDLSKAWKLGAEINNIIEIYKQVILWPYILWINAKILFLRWFYSKFDIVKDIVKDEE